MHLKFWLFVVHVLRLLMADFIWSRAFSFQKLMNSYLFLKIYVASLLIFQASPVMIGGRQAFVEEKRPTTTRGKSVWNSYIVLPGCKYYCRLTLKASDWYRHADWCRHAVTIIFKLTRKLSLFTSLKPLISFRGRVLPFEPYLVWSEFMLEVNDNYRCISTLIIF